MSTAYWVGIFFEYLRGVGHMQSPKSLHAVSASYFSDRPGKDIPMNEENQTEENQTVKHMASVKAAWDNAPEGPKKVTALKHYLAAEKAHEAENDEEAHNELKQASRALV